MPTKILYKFSIPRTIEVEKTFENEDGSKTIRKVLEEIQQEYAIIRPGLSYISDGELYYNEKYHQFLRAGIMSEMMLRKKYTDDNGVFAKADHDQKTEILTKWLQNTSELKKLEKQEVLTDEEKSRVEELYKEDKALKEEISFFDRYEQSIFDNSAETLARDKTVFWWLLKLLYKVSGDNLVPVFPGAEFEDRLSEYEILNEEMQDETENGKFYSKLIGRASFLVSLFYINGVVKPEQFAELVEKYDKELEKDK